MKLKTVAGLLAFSFAPFSAFAIPIAVDGFSVTLESTGLGAATALTIGPDGRLYAADYAGGRVLRNNGAGGFDLVASGMPFVTGLAFTSTGQLFAASSTGSSSTIYEIVNGSTAAFATGFSFPTSLAAFGSYLYVSNSGDGTIARVSTDGLVSQLALQLSAPSGPYGLSFSEAGNLRFIDHLTGGVYSYDFLDAPTLVASVTPLGGTFTSVGFEHDLFATDVNTGTLLRINGGAASVFATGFSAKVLPPFIGPNGLAFDGVDSLYVGDGDNVWRIRRTTSIPEPPSLALLLIGLAAFSAGRKKAVSG